MLEQEALYSTREALCLERTMQVVLRSQNCMLSLTGRDRSLQVIPTSAHIPIAGAAGPVSSVRVSSDTMQMKHMHCIQIVRCRAALIRGQVHCADGGHPCFHLPVGFLKYFRHSLIMSLGKRFSYGMADIQNLSVS